MEGRSHTITSKQRTAVSTAVILFLLVLSLAVVVTACTSRVPHASAVTQLAHSDSPASESTMSDETSGLADMHESDDALVVHVIGHVVHPGIVSLAAGSRVSAAIAAAGGPTSEADLASVNLARVLFDGEQIEVLAPGETPRLPAAAANTAATGEGAAAVNINTASSEQLQTLPRIGPAMAQKIIAYREKMGGFASIDELRNVSGVGEKTFEALAGLITV